jgi:hypothetical protein
MAQQTAVEWAMSQIIRGHFIGFAEEFQIIYDKAKAMEKEQIIDAWDDGDYAYFYSKETGRDFENGEEYYNETYNK